MRNANAQGTGIGVENPASPGFDSLGDDFGGTASRGPDGWYSVDEAGDEDGNSALPQPSTSESSIALSTNAPTIWDGIIAQSWLLASLIALIAALGGIIAIMWLRRKQEVEATLEAPATVLTAGVRASMGDELEASQDERGQANPEIDPEPKPEPAAGPTSTAQPPVPPPAATQSSTTDAAPPIVPSLPLKIELALDIANASRSLMRLTVDFSLEVTNLAQEPVRDLSIAGELACAQEGTTSPAPVDNTAPIAKLERIAPQQSRRVKGTLQMPVQEITAINQNGRPVVIPLIHFRLGVLDQPPVKRSFVLGTPSASSVTRVHPLVLGGPPGSLPPLRAQLIKHP
ncbi:MAG: hypothetical protein ABJ205_04205 [Erythrobacter sp.]|uniref:hypothetical protein n=1 Tax=Erythrobacter sp. TaxID=1042 RepID=UPI003263ECB6